MFFALSGLIAMHLTPIRRIAASMFTPAGAVVDVNSCAGSRWNIYLLSYLGTLYLHYKQEGHLV
jgi:hypothetical protein